ncbi:MAG: hypothetical protein SGARI_007657 [Bacillariaceae sp.]
MAFSKCFSSSQEFYQKNMTKVQNKLKESLEKQTMSMDSLERLSNALATSTPDDEAAAAMVDTTTSTEQPSQDLAAKLAEEHLAAKQLKGENTAPKAAIHKKSKKRKHAVAKSDSKMDTTAATKEKRRPRYFVQF